MTHTLTFLDSINLVMHINKPFLSTQQSVALDLFSKANVIEKDEFFGPPFHKITVFGVKLNQVQTVSDILNSDL